MARRLIDGLLRLFGKKRRKGMALPSWAAKR